MCTVLLYLENILWLPGGKIYVVVKGNLICFVVVIGKLANLIKNIYIYIYTYYTLYIHQLIPLYVIYPSQIFLISTMTGILLSWPATNMRGVEVLLHLQHLDLVWTFLATVKQEKLYWMCFLAMSLVS